MQKIKAEYGPESFAAFIHGLGGKFFKQTLRAYGTEKHCRTLFRSMPRATRCPASPSTFGDGVGSPERTDIENAQCIVLIRIAHRREHA